MLANKWDKKSLKVRNFIELPSNYDQQRGKIGNQQ